MFNMGGIMNMSKTGKSYKKSSKRHYFNLSRIEDVKFKDLVSSSEMVLTLAVPIGSFVNEGDDIYDVWENEPSLKCKRTKLKAASSGYVYSKINYIKNPSEGKYLYTLYSSKEYLIDKLFPNELSIEEDPFTKNKMITGTKFAGDSNGFNMSNLFVSFVFKGGKHHICLRYSKKDVQISKGFTINFLLENGHVLSYLILKRPVKTNNKSSQFMVMIELPSEDILEIKNHGCSQWQILNEEDVVICKGKNTCCNIVSPIMSAIYRAHYGPTYEKLYDAIWGQMNNLAVKDFVNKYLEYSNQIEEIKEENSQVVTNKADQERCYVYLMVDTTNKFYKIGISNDPKYRERTLQSDKPTIELICAKAFPSRVLAEAIESALHKAFRKKRIRGEWFKLSDEDVRYLCETLI